MKIRQKLILGFLTVSMLVAVVGYVSVNISQKTLWNETSISAQVLAENLLGDIERHIYSRIETFEEHCRDFITQQAISESNAEFQKIEDIDAYIAQQDKLWKSAPQTEVTEFMQQLLENDLSREMQNQSEYYYKKYGYPVFAETIVTNKYGANVAIDRKSSDYYQADEEWWQKAKDRGLYVGDVDYDQSAGAHSIALCLRITDDNGDFIGVAKAVLNIHDTFAFLGDRLPVNYTLLTEDNRIIYSTEAHTFLEDITKHPRYNFLLQEGNHYCTVVEKEANQHDAEDHAHEYNSALITHAHAKGFKEFDGLGWGLIVEQDLNKIFASANRLKTWILIISAGITALAAGLGFFLSRSISVPIDKLVVAVESFGRGNLETRVRIPSKDETGKLALAFNRMVEDLKTSTTSIDRLNAVNQQLEASRQQLEASNQQLQSEIAERQAAEKSLIGVNDELEQTIEKLARSNEELQDFAYIASHDLREPLRKISSFGELLKNSIQGTLERDDRENLDFMIDGASRMSQMIEAMLVYSRVNTRDVVFNPVDLNEIVEQFRELELAALLEETNGTIEVPESLPKVLADTVLTRQLMQNLIVNGIKYRNEGVEPRIVITAEHIDDHRVRIKIADNGIGINEELHEAIFKMFKRVHSRQKYEGTGIGLAVCRKIAERHGSQIRVDSAEGKGSVFSFILTPVEEKITVS